MTDGEKLVRAKEILEIVTAEEDCLIKGYLTDAEYFILSVTGQSTIPPILDRAQVDLAVSMYSKRGAEGESAHSEGGVSMTFDSLSPALQLLLRSQSLARIVNQSS